MNKSRAYKNSPKSKLQLPQNLFFEGYKYDYRIAAIFTESIYIPSGLLALQG